MGENWSTITENPPRGFDPTLSLIAALVCHFQSGRLDIMNGKMEAAFVPDILFHDSKIDEHPAHSHVTLRHG